MTFRPTPRPQPAELPSNRSFGLLFAGVFALIGLWPLTRGVTPHLWAFALGGVFLLAGLATPSLLALPNRLWMRFGALLHRIVSPIVLGILFFLVITPFGLAMRLAGKDPLRLKFDRSAPSYWLKRAPPGPAPESMTNQF